MKRLTVQYQNEPCYDIVFSNSFDMLPDEIKVLNSENRSICIVTDTNVEKLYLQNVKELLEPVCKKVVSFAFQAGEEYKTLESVMDLYEFLIQNKFTRTDLLVALGGGVVGDMTGFAAASFLRGIDFVQIPTTLLSQVDSSIGGKTGVDFRQYKNMVGAFHMPKLVYTNIATLRSLDERQYASGFAEVMKHGIIKDSEYYTWLLQKMYEINDRDTNTLMEMVYRSDLIKKEVVENDPTEKGERALLNFGHTIGHAIEKASNFKLLHGECVALGSVAAANISYMHNLIGEDEYLEIRDMFVPFLLPITIHDVQITPQEVLANTKSDKKNATGTLKFVLIRKLGQAFIDTTVTDDEILQAVQDLL